MPSITDLYKKRQREGKRERARRQREWEAHLAAEEVQRAKEAREQAARDLAARKRTFKESGLLSMLRGLERGLALVYEVWPDYTGAVVGQVRTKKLPEWSERYIYYERGEKYPRREAEEKSAKWKVLCGAEIEVEKGGLITIGGWSKFWAEDGWKGLQEGLVDEIAGGIERERVVKKIRRTFLGF